MDGPLAFDVARELTAIPITLVPTSIDVGQSFNATSGGRDGVPPFSFVWSGLPSGCVSSSAANLTCTPATSGSYSIYVTITDLDGVSIKVGAASVKVYSAEKNGALTATRSTIEYGQALTLHAGFSGGMPPWAVEWAGLPAGCPPVSSTYLNCTPTASGTWNVSANESDAAGYRAADGPLKVVVVPAIAESNLTMTPSTTDVGSVVRLSFQVLGGLGPFNVQYSGLPPGCSSSNTLALNCTPSAPGSYTLDVNVTDSLGGIARGSVGLSVNPAPSVNSFVATPSALDVGQVTELVANGIGGTGELSWTYFGLPSGCASQNSSSLVCTPTLPSNSTVTVSVTDQLGRSANRTLALTIAARLSITTLSAVPGSVIVGATVQIQVSTTGGTSPVSIRFAGLWNGCLASGSSFSCVTSVLGPFNLTATATDLTGAQAAQTVHLDVGPIALSIPAFTASPATFTLGNTTVLHTTSRGGLAPVQFDYSGLPTGCSSANVANLSCTPAVTGAFNIIASVSDSAGQVQHAGLTIDVLQPAATGPSGPNRTTPNGTGGAGPWGMLGEPGAVAVIVGVVVVALISAAIFLRSRRVSRVDPTGENETEPSAPSEDAAPSAEEETLVYPVDPTLPKE